jgi:beta-glucanase (GH16 family)
MYRIVSYRIISYIMYRIVSYHIIYHVSYRVISYHIIYHVSYRILSYHIIYQLFDDEQIISQYMDSNTIAQYTLPTYMQNTYC